MEIHLVVEAENTQREYLKLAGLFAYFVLAATLMSGLQGFAWEEWIRWFMGGVLINLGSFKLINYELFVALFPSFDLIARRYKYYAFAYPFIEVILGGLFIMNGNLFPVGLATFALMAVSTIGALKSFMHGEIGLRYGCMGSLLRMSFLTVYVIEDIMVLVTAVIFLLGHALL